MPKNKGKGGKNKRRGKNNAENTKREIPIAEEGQNYGQVTRMLGNGRAEIRLFGKAQPVLGKIRGAMRKRVWIGAGDIVLIGLREFEEDKVDIIDKYQIDEARKLKAQGEIPDETDINKVDRIGDDDDNIPFDFEEI